MPVRLAVGDISTFRKYVKNIGRAYQKRSVAMIQLCRLFLEISPGKPDQTDALRSLFDIVEDALRSAVEAGKGRSEVADEAFATAEEQLDQYTVRYHAREQGVLGDVHDIIEDAAQKDSQIMKTYNRLSSRLGLSKADTPRSSSLVKVRFQILHSPTDRHLAPIVTCELGPEVNVSELLWTFSRLPEDQRVTLKQNPHFYLSGDLSDRPHAYDDKFVLKPLKDLKPEKDLVVMILSDRNGQIYFDYEKFSKTYGNIWKPHNTVILKDLQGTLEAANRISPKINGEVCIWQRGGDRPDGDLTEWTKVLDQALSAPDADWLIRSETSCDEAFGIEVTGGWERCSPIKEPEPAPVFGLGNSVTPTPSREDVLTPPEDAPSLDYGSGSTLDSSDQSSHYFMDDASPSDDTVNSSVEELQGIVEEYSLPVEDAVSSGSEVFFPLNAGVHVETAVPSPVPTPHALPELLDPPIGTEPDAASSVFVPDSIITFKTTHPLVETVHVPSQPSPPPPQPTPPSPQPTPPPPQPTPPPPEPPTPPISNDEAGASDGGSGLDSTPSLSESNHPQLQLAHPPAQTLPSPTPPVNAPTPSIVTPPENARRQVEVVLLPAQPIHSPPQPLTRPTESKPAPESDVAASPKLPPTPKPVPQQVEVIRTPVQPVQAPPGPQASAPPTIKQVPSSVAVPSAPSAPEHARPRIEPVHPMNLPSRPEALGPPLRSNPATPSNAPAPDRVAAPLESARPLVEMVRRPVQIVPVRQSLAPPTGSRPAPAGSASAPSKTIPAPERTRPLAVEAVRVPTQHTRQAPKSMAPVGNASPAEYTTLTLSGTRSQAAAVPRPVQIVHPTPRSSALPVRRGPVPASSVPAPNTIRLPLERARPQVGAGRPPTLVHRAPPDPRVAPVGSHPAANASGPDTKEVSRNRIKSHPRKMVTPVGQRRSVFAPAPMATQPTAPPPGRPKTPPVQRSTTRLAPQNGNSLPLQVMSAGMSSASSLPKAQEKPIVRTTPTLAPAVPTVPLAAPPATLPVAALPTRVGNMTSVTSPTVLESAPRMPNTDRSTGRSRQPTIVSEPPRPVVRPPALSLVHPEQSATSSPSNRSSSTPIARQDRATVVLPDSNRQKRADPVSIPGGWDEPKVNPTETTTVLIPAPASKAASAAAPVGNAAILPTPAASNVSSTPPTSNPTRESRLPTALPEPKAPQMTVRLPAQPVPLPKQKTEPATSPLPNSEPVAITRHGATIEPSSYGPRAKTSGVASAAETPPGEPRTQSTAPTITHRETTEPPFNGPRAETSGVVSAAETPRSEPKPQSTAPTLAHRETREPSFYGSRAETSGVMSGAETPRGETKPQSTAPTITHPETTEPSFYGSRAETSGMVSRAETPRGEPKPQSTAPTITHRETTEPSFYGSRAEASGVMSGAEISRGEPKSHSTATTVLPRQQVGSVTVVPEPVLRSSARRITSRIKTKDLINRHKPQIANDMRSPSTAQSVGTPTLSKSPILDTSQPTPAKPDPNRIDSGIELWDYSEPFGAKGDRQKGSNIPVHGVNKGPADGAAGSMLPRKLSAVLDSADSEEGSSLPLPRQELPVLISKSPEHRASIHPPPSPPQEPILVPAPNTPEPPQTEPPASTPPGRGGAFLTRKPQASFQTAIQGSAPGYPGGYPENFTPPRSSTPSSMTHATTAATSTQVTLVTPASSFHNVSSLGTKAQPKSWFRRNVLDPFKTKLGLASS